MRPGEKAARGDSCTKYFRKGCVWLVQDQHSVSSHRGGEGSELGIMGFTFLKERPEA